MTEENKKNEIETEEDKMVFKTFKKVEKPKKGGKDKKLTESRDSLKLLRKYTRQKNIDNTMLKRKIELAWMFVKESFAKIASQRRNHQYLLMIYEKGGVDIKREFIEQTLLEIVPVSYSEYGKGLVLYLYKNNESNKGRIMEAFRKNIRHMLTNPNALTLIDEIYNMNKSEKRSGFTGVVKAYVDESSDEDKAEESTEVNEDIKEDDTKEDNNNEIKKDEHTKQQVISNNQITQEDGKASIKIYKEAFPKRIYKLFNRRILNFEIVHDVLFYYFSRNEDKYKFFYGLIVRNKQLKYFPLTHKGLELCLELLKKDEENIFNYLEILREDFVSIVNSKYGVVFVLKVLELNIPDSTKFVVDQYVKNYKTIFVSEESIQPIIYLFNQEKKHFGTLFNHTRSKVMVEIDRSPFIDDLRKMVLGNIDVFVSTFTYPIVFFLAKKDTEANKAVKKYFKKIEINNPETEKLHKKLIKYKVIKS